MFWSRIEPDAHAVIAWAEERDVADALDARQGILDARGGEVAQFELAKLETLLLEDRIQFLFRDEIDGQEDAGGFLLGGDALLLDLFRQLGQRDVHSVLHKHL